MNRVIVRNGWYCDCDINGDFAALIRDSHIETSRGRVELCPGGNVLHLRMRIVHDRLHLAGQGHQDGAAWLWDGRTWIRAYHTTNGQKVVAFGPGGFYVASSPHTVHVLNLSSGEVTQRAIAPGSGGIQYVTDQDEVVLGDATYGKGPDQHPGVAEWSHLGGDLYIGQGYDGGAILRGRVLEAGHCTFIHAYRASDRLAVSIVKPEGSVFHWLTVNDIEQLPKPHAPKPDEPKPDPPPVDPPKEPKMPWTPQMPNRQDVVERLKDEHPDEWAGMNRDEHDLRFIKRLVWVLHEDDPRWGLLGQRGDPNDIAGDCVAFKNPTVDNGPEAADVVAAHMSPAAHPTWQNITKDSQGWNADGVKEAEGGAGAAWVQPEPVAGAEPPTPGEPKPPTPTPPQTVADPRLAAPYAALLSIASQLAAIKPADVQQPPPPPDCPPCELPHGECKHPDYGAMMAMIHEADRQKPGALGGEFSAHLVYRFLIEGYTHEQLVQEARGRG